MPSSVALLALLGLVFVAIPQVICRAMRVPVAGGVRRTIGTGVGIAFALFGLQMAFGLGAATFVAVCACLTVAFTVYGSARRYARLQALCDAATGAAGATSPGPLDPLEEQLRSWWVDGTERPAGTAAWSLKFVQLALTSGHSERAKAWLDLIPTGALSNDMKGVAAQYRASAHLHEGAHAAARAALAAAPRPATSQTFEEALAGTEALVDLLEGCVTGDELAKRALDSRVTPEARPIWQAVRAHALAAMDSESELRALLVEMLADEGPKAIERLIAHQGPASSFAKRLLAEEGPYR